jgi:hypothetical protein
MESVQKLHEGMGGRAGGRRASGGGARRPHTHAHTHSRTRAHPHARVRTHSHTHARAHAHPRAHPRTHTRTRARTVSHCRTVSGRQPVQTQARRGAGGTAAAVRPAGAGPALPLLRVRAYAHTHSRTHARTPAVTRAPARARTHAPTVQVVRVQLYTAVRPDCGGGAAQPAGAGRTAAQPSPRAQAPLFPFSASGRTLIRTRARTRAHPP